MPEEKYIVRSKQQPIGTIPECSVGEYVKQRLDQLSPDKIVLIDANLDRKVTKQQLDIQTNNIASALLELGALESEDRALFYADDSIEYFVTNLAMMYLGLTTSPVTPANGAYETGQQLIQTNGKMIFISVNKLPVIRQMLDDDTVNGPLLSKLRMLVILDGDALEETELTTIASHRNSPPNVTTFQKLLQIGAGKQLKQIPHFRVEHPDRHPFTIVFTSGTTGLPKGAIQSHRSLIAAIEAAKYSFEYRWYQDSMLGFVFPFGHISGTFFMLFGLIHRMTCVMFSKYSEEIYLKSIEKYRINVAIMMPGFSLALYETDYTKLYDLSSLQLIIFGGSKYPQNVIEGIRERYKVVMSDLYGATEFILGLSNQDGDYPYGSVGSPIPNVEMKIVDLTSGDSLPLRMDGEICMRGPNCFIGYLNNPKATAETIDEEGWYHTGDVGHYDEQGRLYITDRIKELMKYKHWSVAPSEVEGFLQTHPAVFASCVVGVPHKTEGYHLRAYIQLVEGQLVTEQELVNFVKENMGYQRRLNGGVQFISDMPRTIIGKVDRKHFKNIVKEELLTEPAEPQ